MALSFRPTMRSEEFEHWTEIGSGGFGYVYKARHKPSKFYMAVKILHRDCCTTIDHDKAVSKEVNYMDLASCPYVVMVQGFFAGIPPYGGSMVKGIVMEFLDKGSVQSLLTGQPPPWALAFRLAHQVALGMNFLHTKGLVHQDLKPSNVLLTKELNAKLADFGLSRFSTSTMNDSEMSEEAIVGGSYKYMPPEALLDDSYKPCRSFDVYSYGIFLSSLFNGKEPYPGAGKALVKTNVGEKGQRPPYKELEQKNVKGLKELVSLMINCWKVKSTDRPDFHKCVDVTEMVSSMYSDLEIRTAVNDILDSLTSNSCSSTSASLSSPQTTEEPHDSVDNIVGRLSAQGLDTTKTMSDEEKANFIDVNKLKLTENVIKVMEIVKYLGDMVSSNIFTTIEVSPKRQEKMRELFQTSLRSGGVFVKAAFFDALKIHEQELMRELGA